MRWKPPGLVAILVVLLVAFVPLDLVVPPSRAAQAQQGSRGSEAESRLSCNPERPTVWPGEAIDARAWVSDAGRPLEYGWSATGGHVVGQGPDVTWDFAGVQPGTYTAVVKVSGAGNASETCSMQVVVQEREQGRGVERLTGRSLLVGDVKETQGYGLYSYLLFANPPDESSRERYKKAIEAYLTLMPDVLSLQKYLKLGELNITYVAVDAYAPKFISADWILEHYNYARALVLLRALPGSRRDGPYIVSSLTPLDGKESLPGEYLFQDLSSVPPRLISAWVKLFLNQASQEHFWEPKSAASFALRLRTAIGVLAVGLPEVQNALNGWVSWRQSTSGS